ncbi:UDP-glycosyltransferase 86A1-like [Lycium barbarum]|uniref:Glycosyltransferase n=1 Tax=Lycium barbarum TaxID=112863 RepID=B6EWY8_LYCBA|nr:UDP-glycosyltransferase 86A1-like [Lycium barbarum]BAG80551.1 UDP-glucose:glucosyltransferase [Lycium barbarum]
MEPEEHIKLHAIMIPAPLQGHIVPFINLAIKLASKGLTITFVNTQFTHQRLMKAQSISDSSLDYDIFSEARNSGLDVRYTTISDGFPLNFYRAGNHDQFMEGLFHVFSAHVDDLVGNLVNSNHNPPVSCLIADSFYVWPSEIAKKYNLVNISVWTEPALAFTSYYHMDLLRINGHFGSQDNREDTIHYIPGVEAIEPGDLPSYIQDPEPWGIMHRYMFKSLEDARKADIIICNTVQELESSTISALQEKTPFYALGPIFPNGFTKSTIPTNLWTESDPVQWLNSKPKGTVMYISFGSLANISRQDILEMAHGLLLSRVSFIWVVRPDITSSEESNLLPSRFEDDVKDRGLVVPWCSQIDVISHQAIGGFLTHCGWNSVLESIWCKVPMLCFPIFTDQFTNRKLVVSEWKVGVNLCSGRVLKGQEIARKIDCFITEANKLRINLEETRKKLEDALSENGSSGRNYKQLICDLKSKILQKGKIN